MGDLKLEIVDNGNARVIKCGGRIDYDTYRDLKESINGAMSSRIYNIVIDLEKVVYVSTAGWGVVLGNVKQARENGGDIKLAGMKMGVRKSFDLLELGVFVADYGTSEQALKIFRAH